MTEPTVSPQNTAPVTPATAGIPPVQPTYTPEQLQQAIAAAEARVEGKFTQQLSGLTSQFTSAKEQLQQLQAEREAREAERKAEADRMAAEQKAAEEAKLSLEDRFARFQAEAQERNSYFEQELKRRDALLQKNEELRQLEAYKMQRLSEVQEPDTANGHPGIAVQLRDLVGGSSKEEIDASINSMIARTAAILEEVQQAQQIAARNIPGVSPTAGNIGVMDQQDQTRTFSAEDIQAIAPGSEDHMRLRAQYVRGNTGQGMFG